MATPDLSHRRPSARYQELVALYRQMHLEGDKAHALAPEQTFQGMSLIPRAEAVKRWVKQTGAKTLLDYGAGKGLQYRVAFTDALGREYPSIATYWESEVTCYDPAFPPHSTLPDRKFDGVLCTDVLEHCPEQDLPWIVNELFAYSEKFVYAVAACYPARKNLPNGENAHCTVKPEAWWRLLFGAIAAHYPHIRFELVCAVRKASEESP